MNEGKRTAVARVTPSLDALTDQAARLVVSAAQEAVAARGMFHLALSGGHTPRPVYEKLASAPYRDQIDWAKVQVFFSDERFVPPDSAESNYQMAHEALLSTVPIPERFVHQVATVDITPEESAALYEEGIRRVFRVGLADVPSFDLVLLGLGPDGHTASLFPSSAALGVTDTLVAANHVEKLDAWRVTFTYPLINGARRVAFLVQGEDKAEMVRRVLSGDQELPAARVHPVSGQLHWFLDEAAASRLPQGGVGGVSIQRSSEEGQAGHGEVRPVEQDA